MSILDLEIHLASVRELEYGEAGVVIQGTEGETVFIKIPGDKAIPFRNTVRELVRVYYPEEIEPSDGLDTTHRIDSDQ